MSELLAWIAIVAVIIVVSCMKSQGREIQHLKRQLSELCDRIRCLELGQPRVSEPEEVPEAPSLPWAPPKDELPKPFKPEPKAIPVVEDQSPPSPPKEPLKTPVFDLSKLKSIPLPPKESVSNAEWWSRMEKAVGLKWTTWVGGLILFLGAGFFVKYAFDNSWLGPWTGVILSALGGVAVLLTGERFLRRDMFRLGQGLVGVGLAILYASSFGAYGNELMPQSVTFVFMILVTVVGMGLAVHHDALAIGFFAVLGGILTPILLSSGQDSRDALFAYLLLLDLGVLGVACFKKWRALDVLAFVGTALLFTGWYANYHDADTYDLAPTLAWLIAFYLVFLLVPFVYHLRLGTPITGERFFLAVSNAIGMFGGAYTILHPDHKTLLGILTLGMSGSYLCLGQLTRQRIKEDARAVFGFAALFLAFLIITVPIWLDLYGVTIAWAIKAPLLLYLAYKYEYRPVRFGSLIPLVLALGRIVVIHPPVYTSDFSLFLNAQFGSALFVMLAGALYVAVHHKQGARDNERVLTRGLGIAFGFLTVALIHLELWQWLGLAGYDQAQRWATSLIWSLGTGAFVLWARRFRANYVFVAGVALLWIAMFLGIWDYSLGAVADYALFANGRFWAGMVCVALFFVYGYWSPVLNAKEASDPHIGKSLFYAIGLLLLILLVSAETWLYLGVHNRRYAARCLLPIIWTLGAGAYLGLGIRTPSCRLRQCAIGVTALACAIGFWGYLYRVEAEIGLVLNCRFLALLFPLLITMVQAYLFQRPFTWRQDMERDISDRLWALGCIGCTVLFSVEQWFWLTTREYDYAARYLLPIIWSAGAGACLVLGLRIPSYLLRKCAVTLTAVASALGFFGYAYRVESELLLGLNGRFLAMLLPMGVCLLHAFLFQRSSNWRQKEEANISDLLWMLGYIGCAVLFSMEQWYWFTARGYMYAARCIGPMLWIAASALSVYTGFRIQSTRLRQVSLGMVLLASAWGLQAYVYSYPLTVFFNARFLTELAAIVFMFGLGVVIQRANAAMDDREHAISVYLNVLAAVLLFVLFNIEIIKNVAQGITDPARIRWVTQMSLSLVWALYAIAMLSIGFWRHVRVLRLCALGLFGLTALKVVLFDMAQLEEVYRIVSFIVLGMLMIGASYLYHRVEKQLTEGQRTEDG